MRLFASSPRVFGIRVGVIAGPEDGRAVAATTRFFLPFWTNVAFLAIWIGLSAWAVLTMHAGPYLFEGQVVAVLFFGMLVGAPWGFLTIICAILRAGR